MTINLELKQAIYNELNTLLDEKITAIRQAMTETSDSMKNDTKSSAGDKFETGREMMQIELNNQQVQLNKLTQLHHDLSLIKLSEIHTSIGFGTLVNTSMGCYFVSVALGKIVLDTANYYALSLASPIGRTLHEAKVGDVLTFQGKKIEILDMV